MRRGRPGVYLSRCGRETGKRDNHNNHNNGGSHLCRPNAEAGCGRATPADPDTLVRRSARSDLGWRLRGLRRHALAPLASLGRQPCEPGESLSACSSFLFPPCAQSYCQQSHTITVHGKRSHLVTEQLLPNRYINKHCALLIPVHVPSSFNILVLFTSILE